MLTRSIRRKGSYEDTDELPADRFEAPFLQLLNPQICGYARSFRRSRIGLLGAPRHGLLGANRRSIRRTNMALNSFDSGAYRPLNGLTIPKGIRLNLLNAAGLWTIIMDQQSASMPRKHAFSDAEDGTRLGPSKKPRRRAMHMQVWTVRYPGSRRDARRLNQHSQRLEWVVPTLVVFATSMQAAKPDQNRSQSICISPKTNERNVARYQLSPLRRQSFLTGFGAVPSQENLVHSAPSPTSEPCR